MNACQSIVASLLLASAIGGAAVAAPPALRERVAAIESATTTELARLEAALAATSDAKTALELQRCAAWVKLSARLALHESQLADLPADAEAARALDALVTDLRERVTAQAALLPADYTFAPLAALESEVPACAQ